jgi:hypothetical protein
MVGIDLQGLGDERAEDAFRKGKRHRDDPLEPCDDGKRMASQIIRERHFRIWNLGCHSRGS